MLNQLPLDQDFEWTPKLLLKGYIYVGPGQQFSPSTPNSNVNRGVRGANTLKIRPPENEIFGYFDHSQAPTPPIYTYIYIIYIYYIYILYIYDIYMCVYRPVDGQNIRKISFSEA